MRKKLISRLSAAWIALSLLPVPAAMADEYNFAKVVNVESDNAGNIFFSGDEAVLRVTVQNNTDSELSVNVNYKIYSLGNDDSRTLIEETNKTLNLAGATKDIDSYMVSKAERYGRYIFDVTLSGNGNTTTKSFEFSRSVYSSNQNMNFGINSHAGNGNGSPEKLFSLARKAGIGLVRETYNWESYEPVAGGEKALTAEQKSSLEKMEKYGLEPLIVIYGNNRAYEKGDFVTADNADNYKNYIKSFVSEAEMANVKNFEIYNEPDMETKASYKGNTITDTDSKTANELRGEYYAVMLTNAYDAIKEVRPNDTEVSGLSFCKISNDVATKDFLNGVATGIKSYYQTKGKLPFDNVSVHPYIGHLDPEKGVNGNDANVRCELCESYHTGYYAKSQQGMLEEMKEYFNEQIGVSEALSDYPLNVTEYGYSNPVVDNMLNYAKSEHDQAMLNLRSFLVMKGEAPEQKNYVYNLMDKGLERDNKEHNWGMLHNEYYTVPYAAKAGYLTTAAFNNFTADAYASEYVYDDNYNNVLKFTKKNGDVYAIWTSNQDGSTIAYDFGNNVSFYDAYGNVLTEAEVKSGDKYKTSTDVYYAVTGDAVKFEQEETSIRPFIRIAGKISSGLSGKKVSLTVLPEEKGFGANMLNDIVYFDQSVTFNNGEFEFKLQNLEHEKRYTAYVVAEDASVPLSFDFIDTMYPTFIKLYSGDVKITSANIDLLDIKDAYLKIAFGEKDNITSYTAVCACYNDGTLTYVKKADGIYENDGKSIEIDVSAQDDVKYDTVKLLLWNSDGEMLPLCDAELYIK